MAIKIGTEVKQVSRAFVSEFYYICDFEHKDYVCLKNRDYILLQIYSTMCCKPNKIFMLYDCSSNKVIHEKINGFSHGHTDFTRRVSAEEWNKASVAYVVFFFF